MAGRTWSTYRTSPLHPFDDERLDAYAEGLRQLIAAECQRAVGPRYRFLSAVYAVARPGGTSITSVPTMWGTRGLLSTHNPSECGPVYAFVVGAQSVEGAELWCVFTINRRLRWRSEEGVLPEERPLLQAVMLRSRQSEPDATGMPLLRAFNDGSSLMPLRCAENPAPYPVLLVRANKVFVDAFHSWFQSQVLRCFAV